MEQLKQSESQKVHLFAWGLIICNTLFFLCDSPTMGIRFYLPIFFFTLGCGIFSLFRYRLAMGIEHFTCLVLFVIIALHLNNSLVGFGEKNAALFSETVLIIFFFVFSLFKYNLRELRYLINSLIIASTGFSILLFLFSFHLGQGHYTIRPFNGYYDYIDPNYLSSFMVIPCIILMKRAVFTHKNLFAYILFFVNVLAILLTGSRAAMLSLLIACGILCTVRRNFKVLFAVCIMLVSVISGVLLFLNMEVVERLFIRSYVDGSNSLRVDYWVSHILFTLEYSPFIGFGLSGIQHGWELNTTSHSTFISLFASFGLVGIVFIGVLLLKIAQSLLTKDTILFFALFIAFLFVNQMIPASTSYSFWGILLIFCLVVRFKQNFPDISLWDEL